MTKFEIATRVENIAISLWGISSYVCALQDAMFHGSSAAQSYEGAVFALMEGIDRLEKSVRGTADDIYEDFRKEKQ